MTTYSERQQQVIDAITFLAGRCDGARTWDAKGFNGRDVSFGHAMAERAEAGQAFTAKMLRAMCKLAQTYRATQLEPAGLALPTVAELDADLAEHPLGQPAPARRERFSVERLADPIWCRVQFAYGDLDEFKARVPYQARSWDRVERVWYVRTEYATVLSAGAPQPGDRAEAAYDGDALAAASHWGVDLQAPDFWSQVEQQIVWA